MVVIEVLVKLRHVISREQERMMGLVMLLLRFIMD